jgi:hypothetical protein
LNLEKRSQYLRRQILAHISHFFSMEAFGTVKTVSVNFLSHREAIQCREPIIAIPNDIVAPLNPDRPYQVPFNGTTLTLWNQLPKPDGDEWQSLPNPLTPLWYRHSQGTLIPAWNLFGNLFDLLTFREEREIHQRDRHGRFIADYSPRLKAGLIEIPAFNEAVAVLVSATYSLKHNTALDILPAGLLKKPVIILSHDCDILRGNDFWTQAVRAARIVIPLKKGRMPHLSNFWWVIRNYFRPRDYYFDNVIGMINMEKIFGYKSTFYLLNGSGGRFGARNGGAILRELIPSIPPGWDIGIHYNYDTFLNQGTFAEQKEELSKIMGRPSFIGRAHYLRFDTEKSPAFLKSNGILCDESVGFPDFIGFRTGLGGCFIPYDPESEQELGILEIPMNIMDATLLDQYKDEAVNRFDLWLKHFHQIGGAISMIFHPGFFFNPEFPKRLGLYHKLLQICRKYEAGAQTASSFIDKFQTNVK